MNEQTKTDGLLENAAVLLDRMKRSETFDGARLLFQELERHLADAGLSGAEVDAYYERTRT